MNAAIQTHADATLSPDRFARQMAHLSRCDAIANQAVADYLASRETAADALLDRIEKETIRLLDLADALGLTDCAAVAGLDALLTACWETTQLPPDCPSDAFHAALAGMRDAFDAARVGGDRDLTPGTARDRPWQLCAAIDASTSRALLTDLYLTRPTETESI